MEQAFEEFVDRTGRRLLTTAGLLTQNRQLAEDLYQTTLLKTWTSWDSIRTHPEAFARRTMVNTYASWWRRKWRGEQPTEHLPESPVRDAESSTSLDLRTALARLPARQRTVIVLRFYEDLTEPQVAALMGCSVGTVKSQTSKALAKLGVDEALAPDPQEAHR